MMAKALPFLFQLPFSYAERLALDDEIRLPATLEAYLEFAEQAEYKVEYSNGNIITMGQPTDAHELICGNAITVFNNVLLEDEAFRIYGSNLGIYIKESGAHYKPDASILNTEPEFVLHKVRKRTLKSVANPFAVVEVFSDGTIDYDLTEKLPNYKQCPYLKYIIYVHQHKPFVSLHTRSSHNEGWLSTDHRGLDASFPFEGKQVPLQGIYRKVVFMGGGKRK
ncbi:MAG: Uma2 family endonuclease [Saprospiraceae bacterium]|nr:Uma2 family endonuclease [Saprospiraceae bacterium]